jgi:hypothetical protein
LYCDGGPVWTEMLIAVLALVGLVAAVTGRGLAATRVPLLRQKQCPEAPQEHCLQASSGTPAVVLSTARFLAVYTLVMTVVYSAIPYKTPWCALGLLHGMILLAGIGAAVLIRIVPGYVLKAVVILLLVAATGHLAWQGYRASFVACNNPSTPYAHTPTSLDVPLLVERVREVAAAYADPQAVPIEVICPDDDFWPLPWYLRDLQHVGYYRQVPGQSTPLVIIVDPKVKPALIKKLFETLPPGERYLYAELLPEDEPRGWRLRRNYFLQAYVRSDLWDAYQAAVAEGPPPEKTLPRENQ